MPGKPEYGPITRPLEALVRAWVSFQERRSARPRVRRRRGPVTAVSEQPVPDVRVQRSMRLIGWVLAPVLSLAVGAVLVALRGEVDRSTATLILVLPVVFVAVIGGPGPAALAAIMAPLTFDVLLTEPYYRVQIHAVEDVEATIILLIIGLVVGQLVAHEVRSRVESATRQAEVASLRAVIASAVRGAGEADAAAEATLALTRVLDLRECRWAPGYHGAAHPELVRDGEIVPLPTGRILDRAPLPAGGVELPVVVRGREVGRFVLVPAHRTPLSREERQVAVAIADLFGLALVTDRPGATA